MPVFRLFRENLPDLYILILDINKINLILRWTTLVVLNT